MSIIVRTIKAHKYFDNFLRRYSDYRPIRTHKRILEEVFIVYRMDSPRKYSFLSD